MAFDFWIFTGTMSDSNLESPERKGRTSITGSPDPGDRHVATITYSPNVVAIIFYVVMERAAFLGFSLSMMQYLMEMLDLSSSTTNSIAQTFGFLTYAMSAVGGCVADAFWGRWKVCFYSGIAYLIGMGMAFVSSLPCVWSDFPHQAGPAPMVLFCTALAFIIFGFGSQRLMSVMLADQTAADADDPKTVERVFFLYTTAGNGGPTISVFLLPYLHTFGQQKRTGEEALGTSYYFSFAGCFAFLFAGCVFFFVRRNRYVNAGPPTNGAISDAMFAIQTSIKNRSECPKDERRGRALLDFADKEYSGFSKDLQRILHVVWMFLVFVTVFLFLYGQMGSSIIIQATWMASPSWFPAASIVFFEAVACILFSNLLDLMLCCLKKRFGCTPGLHMRNFVGMLVTVVCFVYYAILQLYISSHGSYSDDGSFSSSVSIWWQIPGQLLLALSSTLVLASSMEYAMTIAPKYMKNIILALLSMSFGLGCLLSVPVSPVITVDKLMYTFMGLSGVMLLTAVVYIVLYWKYDREMEEDDKGTGDGLDDSVEDSVECVENIGGEDESKKNTSSV